MEEKLGGRQAGQIRVFDEAARVWSVVIFDKMRQRSMPKAEWNALSLHVLLPDARDDLQRVATSGSVDKAFFVFAAYLRDVDLGAF